MTMTLKQFRATRSTDLSSINPDELPSDAPATEQYVYRILQGGFEMNWFIRREAEGSVYMWSHPCNEFCATLAKAEAALLKHVNG
jgi:hypothetical protein